MSARNYGDETSMDGLLFGRDALHELFEGLLRQGRRIFMLTDHNTQESCVPLMPVSENGRIHFHSVLPGEGSKSIETVAEIWQALSEAHFDRHDLFINLGGGMICDLGGFAASCYKRGIEFVNIPTTLLAMADAAVGGKTGINFSGAKNQIGAFRSASVVVIDTAFLKTLPLRELRAGYAEVLKHFLIHDAASWYQAASEKALPTEWESTVETAVRTKLHFTLADPEEKGIRKALNFGHTVGHALESHFLQQYPGKALLHGEAVAVGMACEAFLSFQRGLIDKTEFHSIHHTLYNVFGQYEFTAQEIPTIVKWSQQDKKNTGGQVNCSLLKGIGDFSIDQFVTVSELETCLLAYQSGFPEDFRP